MRAPPLDRITKSALLGAGLLFMLAGAGWAYWGTDLFVSAIMAGLAYCF
ncbi:MAG TPA: hypothetical protein VGA77_13830 [Propylenella sp.]